jgi:Na+/H+ antiporter NhaC
MEAWIEGIKELVDPLIILLLAWALGAAIGDIKTADYLVSALGKHMPHGILPFAATLAAFASTFSFVHVLMYARVCACDCGCTRVDSMCTRVPSYRCSLISPHTRACARSVSFATGSAFGTMAILFPLVIPLAASMAPNNADLLVQCVGSITGGSVFGNTCTWIADNSVLTVLAAKIELNEHIRTQAAYIMFVAIVSLLFGTLPCGIFDWYPAWLGLLLGVGVEALVLLVFGRTPSAHAHASNAPTSRDAMQDETTVLLGS